MKLAQAKNVESVARSRYTYSVVPFNLLHWRSHWDAAKAGVDWTGPCGDLVATVLDGLTAGADPVAQLTDCYRLLVSLSGGSTPDHIVGAVLTEDNGFAIVGDTTRLAYTHTAMSHRPFEYNRLSEAGLKPVWREGVPW